MLLCNKIDLDLEDPREVYEKAQNTIEYLQDVIKSLDARLLSGEEIPGFKVVEGSKKRVITEDGFKYLEKVLGHDVVFKTFEKPIGITELEKTLDKEEFAELYNKGVVAFELGKPKVILLKIRD